MISTLVIYLLVIGTINRSLSNDQLQFILYPIQLFVSFFENSQFQYLSEFGYVQTDGLIRINASCSGFLFLNVLIAVGVFLVLRLTTLFKWYSLIIRIFFVLILAYLFAVGVNSSRILLSIDLLHVAQNFSWFPNHFVHEAFGIFSFLVFSSLYYIAVKQMLKRWTN
ncbi:MAG: exosortase K [Flavobacteriales bacterium]|nr:exosortase K [Flavobacteriales bacterium]